MSEITREIFLKHVGTEPIQDDLERCNCLKAGEHMHLDCGWNKQKNKPVFMVGKEKPNE